MIRFANPEFPGLLIVMPLMIFWYIKNARRGGTIRFSHLGVIKTVSKTPSKKFRHILFVFRIIVIALMVVAFARPQSGSTEEEIITEGIDIILAMDISSSMKAEDLAKRRNRLDVTKEVARSTERDE